MTTKTCRVCEAEKPTTAFRRHHDGSMMHYCEECHLAKRRKEYARAKEHRTAIRRAAYAVNAGGYKDKAHERNKARYERLGRAPLKEWMEQNPDRVREIGRAKMARHRERLSDQYIKTLIVQHTGTIGKDAVPQCLVEAKRQQIQLMRLIDEKCS